MENIHNTYPYEQLDSALREIRLLELLPGSRTDPIRCKLFRHSLGERLEYDAISYTWGDIKSLSHIQVDEDDTFQTPTNTERALQDVRLEDASKILWIDAICINQGSTSERSSQVRVMRDIYSQASTVRVWLDFEIDPQSPMFVRLAGLTEQSSVGELGNDPEFWIPLLHMAGQPYWYRVWVQQELHFARKVLLYCRENQVSIRSIDLQNKLIGQLITNSDRERNFTEWFPYRLMTLQKYGLPDDSAHDIHDDSAPRKKPGDNILDILVGFHSFSSTDARDMVFASVGLLEKSDADQIEIDYTSSPHKICLNVAMHILNKYGSLAFLTHVGQSSNSMSGFPSWLPDWTAREGIVNRIEYEFGRSVNHDTSRTSSTQVPVVTDNVTKLRVSGFRIDSMLKSFENPLEDGSGTDDELMSMTVLTWFRILEELCQVHNPQPVERFATKVKALFQSRQNLHPYGAWDIAHVEALFETLNFDLDPSAREWARRTKEFLDKKCPNPYKRKHNEKKWKSFANRDFSSWNTDRLIFAMRTINMRLFVSHNFRVGLLPPCAKPGDEIWTIFRCPTRMALRKQGNGYIVLGPAFVAGCMRQECTKDMPDVVEPGQRFGDYLIEEITLC